MLFSFLGEEFCLLQWVGSDGLFALFLGANADGFVDGRDEDFAIADLPGLGRADDRTNGSVDAVIGDHHFDFDLRQEIDRVFAAAIDFSVALLAAKPFDFTDRHPLDADVAEGVFNFFQFEGLNYGFDFLHKRLSWWCANFGHRRGPGMSEHALSS